MSQTRHSSIARGSAGARGAGLTGLLQNLIFLLAVGFAAAIVLGLVP